MLGVLLHALSTHVGILVSFLLVSFLLFLPVSLSLSPCLTLFLPVSLSDSLSHSLTPCLTLRLRCSRPTSLSVSPPSPLPSLPLSLPPPSASLTPRSRSASTRHTFSKVSALLYLREKVTVCSLLRMCIYRSTKEHPTPHKPKPPRAPPDVCPKEPQRRMCSLTAECVLLLQNVFSYYRMCSLTCV